MGTWPSQPAKYHPLRRMMLSRKALYQLYIIEGRTQREISVFHKEAFGIEISRSTVGIYLRAYRIKLPDLKNTRVECHRRGYSTILSYIRMGKWEKARDIVLAYTPETKYPYRDILVRKLVKNLARRKRLRLGERKFLRWIGRPLKSENFYPTKSTWHLIPKELRPLQYRIKAKRPEHVSIDWVKVERLRVENELSKRRFCKNSRFDIGNYYAAIKGKYPRVRLRSAKKIAKALSLRSYKKIIL